MCSFIFGTTDGLAETVRPEWLRVIQIFYIDSMRAIPVLVVLVSIYFALPADHGLDLSSVLVSPFALSFHLAAYVAEVIRAGVESVRPGQVPPACPWNVRATDRPQDRAAAGDRAHDARLRITPVTRHQGHGHRGGDRCARN